MILALSWILVSSSVPSYYHGRFRDKLSTLHLPEGLSWRLPIPSTNWMQCFVVLNSTVTYEEERLLFLAAFIRAAKVVDVTSKVTECIDPKDNKFLELAVSGKATCVVSGDSGLLVLNAFQGV